MKAKELLDGQHGKDQYPTHMEDTLIEFAQYHVEKALEKASKSTLLYDFKDEILNSYPLSNIK